MRRALVTHHQRNVISSNHADSGGGIYCHRSSPQIRNNTFTSNAASNDAWGLGGAIASLYTCVLVVENNTFTGNSISQSGSAISCTEWGGAAGSTVTVRGNTFTSNTTYYNGGALHFSVWKSMSATTSLLQHHHP